MRWCVRASDVAEPAVLGSYLHRVYSSRIVAIQEFASRAVERFFTDGILPGGVGWTRVARIAYRKLDMLDYANALNDLRSPPGNRLESLKGRLAGLQSIRINDQWRVVFRWTADGPRDVDIRDYH